MGDDGTACMRCFVASDADDGADAAVDGDGRR